jgi:hypothetical protein
VSGSTQVHHPATAPPSPSTLVPPTVSLVSVPASLVWLPLLLSFCRFVASAAESAGLSFLRSLQGGMAGWARQMSFLCILG